MDPPGSKDVFATRLKQNLSWEHGLAYSTSEDLLINTVAYPVFHSRKGHRAVSYVR